MKILQGNHTTNDEKLYLANIGKHHIEKARLSRKEMLQNYLASLAKRVNWGEINSIEIKIFAMQQLAACD